MITLIISNEAKEQKGGFFRMLLGISLDTSLLENLLTGEGVFRAGKGVFRDCKGANTAEKKFVQL